MDYIEKRQLILKGKISKVILTLAGPIMANNLIQTLYNLADTYWVSRLGSTEVAAITLIWPVIFLMMALGIGVSIASISLISQYIGSNNMEDAKKVAGQVISFSFIFSSVLGLIGALSAHYIVKAMGGEGILLEKSVTFLRIIFFGMPTLFIFFAFNSIKQGQGDTLTPMKYSAFSALLNIILDPIFIFTLNLGIGGAALATVLSRGIFSLYAVYRLFSVKNGIRLKKDDLYLNKSVLTKLIKIGFPASIGQSTAAFGFIILNAFIIGFGEATMAAFGIGNRIVSLILMPAMGIGSSISTIVGQNLGADNVKRAKEAVKTSAILSTIILAIGGVIVFILSETIIGFFAKNDPIVFNQATYYLKLVIFTMPLMGFFQIFMGTFQGSGHTIMAMILTGGRLWCLRIPLIVLFKNFTDLGSKSVWFAMILSNALICLVGYGLYKSGKWERKVIKKTNIDNE
ncbi:MATE family efflux transporter [Thermohalobacter berrensis]|uniref:MATE family efflux transporter n=1 Tax=Thermohalobacter berrensis TaxID=99594 RepID=A0A419T8X6_9FIRM|nr:MATE family efflux transporter [Thermohalobacter berrensis]RKD33933.1 MATE family efflux transporter [Thermohalobacter berrensis]